MDNRTSGNTYPTTAQAYEAETRVRVEVLDYGPSKPNYQAITKIAMQPISEYVAAGTTQSVKREGTLRDLTNLTCSTTATKTSCEGIIRLSPSLLNIPQSDIDGVKIDNFSISLKPNFYNQAGTVIDTKAEVNNTLDLGPEWKKTLEVSAMYNISPSSPASLRNCPARYGGNTIAFAKRSLVKIVQDTLNPMNDEGYSILCNDASLPFGGKLLTTCPIGSPPNRQCAAAAFPHKGEGHRTGIALDTLDFMKDSGLQGTFATNKGAKKISAAQIMVEYVRDLHVLDTFCADKQLTPYPPLNTIDPELKCQDENGARRFTGRECFMNLEKILAGNDPENTPITSWNWDVDNYSPLPKSLAAAKWCPFLSDTVKLTEVQNYVTYAAEAGGGLSRFKELLPATSIVIFTYGVDDIGLGNAVAVNNWNRSSLVDGFFPIRITFPISSTIAYPLFKEGVQLINRTQMIPITTNHPGHLDHLHVEAK